MTSNRTSAVGARASRRYRPRAHQQGAAALIVVMVLFFVIAMVAAYTNRNLIFEQRTATNQYRTTMAFDAADAAIDWTLAQLNAGRITDTCEASTSSTDKTFRERYFTISPIDGTLPDPMTTVTPMCAFDSSDESSPSNWKWKCNCPQPPAIASLPTTASNGPAPAFKISMRAARPGKFLIDLAAYSCTRADPACLGASPTVQSGDGVASLRTSFALRGALTLLPTGALTLGGALPSATYQTLTVPASVTLNVANTNADSGGITVHAGAYPSGSATAPMPSNVVRTGLPGVPADATVVYPDPALGLQADPELTVLSLSKPERRFTVFFGMRLQTYLQQPGLPIVDCTAGCSASDINGALAANPGRAIFVKGPALGTTASLTIDADIGVDDTSVIPPATRPVLIITDVTIDVVVLNGVTVKGLVYGRKPDWNWTASGTSTFIGAVIAETSLSFVSTSPAAVNISYDKALLEQLRVSYGTFVRVPYSWKDF